MRVYVMPANCRSFEEIHLVERPDPVPGRGQVVVRVRATSLNRRDQAIADGSYFGNPIQRETIPLSDCAGEIAAVGEGVTRVKAGDRVAATFFQTPPMGPPFAEEAALASPLDGVLAEQVHPADRSVQHMVDLSARCISCGSWHGKTIARSRLSVNTSCVPNATKLSAIPNHCCIYGRIQRLFLQWSKI